MEQSRSKRDERGADLDAQRLESLVSEKRQDTIGHGNTPSHRCECAHGNSHWACCSPIASRLVNTQVYETFWVSASPSVKVRNANSSDQRVPVSPPSVPPHKTWPRHSQDSKLKSASRRPRTSSPSTAITLVSPTKARSIQHTRSDGHSPIRGRDDPTASIAASRKVPVKKTPLA